MTINEITNLSVAMIEPEFPLNVGYVARVMANFGLQQLLIVSGKKLRRDEKKEASIFASHGHDIIANINYAKSIADLKKSFDFIVGTTAITGTRKSNITRKTMGVEECARTLSSITSRGHRVCLVFGRDTTGMTNSELQRCDYNVTIGTGTSYNTLNISHAAAIVFYVFLKFFSKKFAPESKVNVRSTRLERMRVIRLFEELAELSDFQKFKRGMLEQTLVRLIERSNPSLRELYLLMGLGSKAITKIRSLETRAHNKG